jgi:hypothetical protein
VSKNRPVCFGRGESQDLDVSKMQRAQGLLDFGATDEESPSGAFFDFVECFGLTLLSMGTITVQHRGSGLDTPRTKSILPPCTAEIETKP